MNESQMRQNFKQQLKPVKDGICQIIIEGVTRSGYENELYEAYKAQFVQRHGNYGVLLNGSQNHQNSTKNILHG